MSDYWRSEVQLVCPILERSMLHLIIYLGSGQSYTPSYYLPWFKAREAKLVMNQAEKVPTNVLQHKNITSIKMLCYQE